MVSAAVKTVAVLTLILVTLLYRPLTIVSRQPASAQIITRAGGVSLTEHLPLDARLFATRLGAAVRCATISSNLANETDTASFVSLNVLLREWFPLVHTRLQVEAVPSGPAMHSLLYTWHAKQASKRPVILLSHLDVVPASASEWSVPPFEGRVSEGFVWGRGTMDDKAGVMSVLQSFEHLLSLGFEPIRDLYAAFGHDEEVGGHNGAKQIARILFERGVRAEMLLDEGQPIVSGVIQGVSRPVALIGTAEKGALTLELTARAAPGHSSMPPPTSAITDLARAMVRVEEASRPLVLSGVTSEMFAFLAPEMSFAFRIATANLWLFGPVLKLLLGRDKATRASLQTTTAVTMVNGGVRHNVLPSEARVIINHRLHPSDSVAHAVALDKSAAGESISVRVLDSFEPSPVASTDGQPFRTLQRAIAEVFPDAISAPSVMIGNTDTIHFWNVTDEIFRFCPVRLSKADLGRYHGIDERVSVTNLAEIADFYYRLLVLLNA